MGTVRLRFVRKPFMTTEFTLITEVTSIWGGSFRVKRRAATVRMSAKAVIERLR